jgi:GcrA cell cycle regulator
VYANEQRWGMIGFWTTERQSVLEAGVKGGKSASQIAAIIGGGVTRNAVIGRMWRTELSTSRKQDSQAARKQRKREYDVRRRMAAKANRPPTKFTSLPIPDPKVIVPESEWVPFPRNNPRTECAAPMGDGKCCGRQISYGSYCWDHANAFYQIKKVA